MKLIENSDEKAYRNTMRYTRRVRRIFAGFFVELEKAFKEGVFPTNVPFDIRNYPKLNARVDGLLQQLSKDLLGNVIDGIKLNWDLSDEKNSALVRDLFGRSLRRFPRALRAELLNGTLKARESFIKRKINGEDLSAKVWKNVKTMKPTILDTVEVGIQTGRSAADLAQDVKKYLENPDALYRRVRDSKGVLRLSKAAKEYHPGAGVYRSATKNAERLTRNEINTAYRSADQERWEAADYVVGVRISVSNNENKQCPRCKELQGDYPKNFKWTAWHVQCMCNKRPILKSEKELQLDTQRILEGKPPLKSSSRTVRKLPKKFKEWYDEHKDKLQKESFVKLNADFLKT